VVGANQWRHMLRDPSRLGSSVRRGFIGLVLGASLCALMAGRAQAVTVEQWNTPGGQWVNPKDETKLDLVNGHLVTNVVLPNNYGSRRCWPVMYLLHGTADATSTQVSLQWLQLNNGALLKMNIPAILVIPGSGDGWWINDWWHGYRHPAWSSWVLQGIVPMVAKRLHVCASRSEHVMAGLSMGGYGAIYLASQLPGYFGAAASFSGVLSPESPNFLSIFPTFTTTWGPADKFYAIGHDPLALVSNLRNTRVFVGSGNGVPITGETDDPVARFEEAEFDQESLAFTAKARAAHVSVTFDQHPGTHSPLNWLDTLSDMLRWNPYKPVRATPKKWTFTTVETNGTAWNYKFAFSRYAPPTKVIQFSLSHGVFAARGGGVVTITPPGGKPVTGKIPFDIVKGKVAEIKHAGTPHVAGGYQKIVPIKMTVTPPATDTGPIRISFTTAQTLPPGYEYNIGAEAVSLGGGACSDTVFQRVPAPSKGKLVTVSLSPPADATTPNTWCHGTTYAGVSELPKGSPATALGTFLGYTGFTVP
jgi:S-formylglutathione hydrolase FrmB